MNSALAFAGLVSVGQIITGTTPIIAVMSFVFILSTVLAFNVAGGAAYPSGAFIAACSLLAGTLGIVVKVFLGEPFQRNLLVPEKTMEVYAVGMMSMLAASYVNRMLRLKRPVLSQFTVDGNATGIAIICMVIGIGAPLVLPEAFVSTFKQANGFLILAIMIPVFETARRTGGERSFNLVSLIALLYLTGLGILSFSKERMYSPSAAWAVAAVGAGYHASVRKLAVLGVAGTLLLMVLTPYSQTARNYGLNLDLTYSVPIAIQLLSHPIELRETYLEQATEQLNDEGNFHLFDKPQGLFDRLNMIAVDDALIRVTDQGRTAEPANLWSYFPNLIPRYLYPDKPILKWGNVYAHTIGMLGDGDETTGISFSPFSDGYHTAQWMGVTVYAFALYLFGFFLMDSIAGSADYSFWPLLYVLFVLHQAPEGMLNAPVYAGGTYGVFTIVTAFTCARLIPILTNLTKPSGKAQEAARIAGVKVQSA